MTDITRVLKDFMDSWYETPIVVYKTRGTDIATGRRFVVTRMAQPLTETPADPSDQEASQKRDGKHPETGR